MSLPDIVRRSPKGLVVAPDPSASADETTARAFGTPVILRYRYGAWHLARRWVEQENLAFIVLGTPKSHRALFHSLVIEGDAVDRLRRLLSKENVDIEICTFAEARNATLDFTEKYDYLRVDIARKPRFKLHNRALHDLAGYVELISDYEILAKT